MERRMIDVWDILGTLRGWEKSAEENPTCQLKAAPLLRKVIDLIQNESRLFGTTEELPESPDPVRYAVETIIGYCNKRTTCSERCRLYDAEKQLCGFRSEDGEPPCDWRLPEDR